MPSNRRYVKGWRSANYFPVNRERVGRKGREGSGDKVTKRRRGKEGVDWGRRLYFDICASPLLPPSSWLPEFLFTPLLMGPVCQLSQGRFEEPVGPWLFISQRWEFFSGTVVWHRAEDDIELWKFQGSPRRRRRRHSLRGRRRRRPRRVLVGRARSPSRW